MKEDKFSIQNILWLKNEYERLIEYEIFVKKLQKSFWKCIFSRHYINKFLNKKT